MKKLGLLLALAFAAHGALANKAVSDESAMPTLPLEAKVRAADVAAEEVTREQTAAAIAQGVDAANRKLESQIDRRISGMLDLSLLQ